MSYCTVLLIHSVIRITFNSLFDFFMQWTPYMDGIEVNTNISSGGSFLCAR